VAHDAVVAAGAVEVGIWLGAAVTYLAGSNHEPTVAPTWHAHRPSLRHSAAGTRNGPGGLLLPQVPFQPPETVAVRAAGHTLGRHLAMDAAHFAEVGCCATRRRAGWRQPL